MMDLDMMMGPVYTSVERYESGPRPVSRPRNRARLRAARGGVPRVAAEHNLMLRRRENAVKVVVVALGSFGRLRAAE